MDRLPSSRGPTPARSRRGARKRIELFTVMLNDGRLFYAIGVMPNGDFSIYQNVFRRVVGSIQLND